MYINKNKHVFYEPVQNYLNIPLETKAFSYQNAIGYHNVLFRYQFQLLLQVYWEKSILYNTVLHTEKFMYFVCTFVFIAL